MPKDNEARTVIVVRGGEVMDERDLVSKHVRARDELIDHFVNAIRQHKDMMPDDAGRPLDQLLWSALEMSVAEINEIRGLNEWCDCEDAFHHHLLWTRWKLGQRLLAGADKLLFLKGQHRSNKGTGDHQEESFRALRLRPQG